jgi:hypothetical protein
VILSSQEAQFVDAVTQSSGSDAAFIVRGLGDLEEYVNGVFSRLPGSDFTPGSNFFQATTISAGLDVNGNADVFALATAANHGTLWRWTNSSQGWTELGGINQFQFISATNNGQVFCLTSFGGELEKFDAQNNLHDLNASEVGEIAAASSNDLYTTATNGSLCELNGTTWHEWGGPRTAE